MAEKPYRLERIERGSVPEIGKLLGATVGEFIDNIGPYAIAGVAQLCVTVPVVLLSLFVIYGSIFGVLIVGAVGTVIAASAVGDDAAPLVTVLGELFSFGGLFVVLSLGITVITAIVAPVQASLVRAVAAQQRGEAKIDFMSCFASVGQDLIPVVVVNLIVAALISVGFLFCYVPGLIAMFACAFAASLVALHRRGAVDAVRLAAQTAFANPGFHIAFFAIIMITSFAAANIPVIGPMFILALQVRASRELFGDGEEPVAPA